MARGHWSKAAESMVPKFLRDPLKALREGGEGVTNYNGEISEQNLFDYANAMLGNTPSRIVAFYDWETVYVEQGDPINIVIAGAAASTSAFVRVCGKRRQT